MDCSSGEATVSAIVLGFAPGYFAWTTTVGGTTSGYSLTGNRQSASKPTKKIMADKTPAKMGRRMKKFEKFIVVPLQADLLRSHAAGLGLVLRRNRHSRMDALQAIDDDFVAFRNAGSNDPFAFDFRAEFHRLISDGIARGQCQNIFAGLVRADGAFIHEERGMPVAHRQADACK